MQKGSVPRSGNYLNARFEVSGYISNLVLGFENLWERQKQTHS
jgi:hypothetical protein